MQNNASVEKYVSVAKYERDLDDIESSMDASDAEFRRDIAKVSRSVVVAHEQLSRWVVASSLAHVVSFVAIVVLAVS